MDDLEDCAKDINKLDDRAPKRKDGGVKKFLINEIEYSFNA
jgi:hypothetical protein